jgi:hypothetical protein
MPKTLKKHKFNEDVERIVMGIVHGEEYLKSKSAKGSDTINFESIIDLMECVRSEKDYSWLSDFFDPELFSIISTDASGWASQYFQTRDFVEVKLEGLTERDVKKCSAAKKCLNGTLNNRGIYHYHKYMRARLINALAGQVYALCWWDKKILPQLIGYSEEYRGDGTEESPMEIVKVPQYGEKVIVDRFNYEPLDPRNVYTDNKYCYSVQEKDYVIIRSETSYEELKADEKPKDYFNLHVVKELYRPDVQTETARETYEQNEESKKGKNAIIQNFDKFIRFGKMWCIVKEREQDGYPSKVIPGYDKDGIPLQEAELFECIIEWVSVRNAQVLIRFQPNPYRDTNGVPYRPVLRGWCYIHPTKDVGLSDGKVLKEINIMINDSINMGMDRVKLATLPTLVGKRSSLEDNTTIFFAPEHIMEVENPREDLQELKMSDDITGVMNLAQYGKLSAQKATAIFPTTMGDVPAQSSTTATAVAGAENRTNIRANYKSLTFEYTYLLDFYWMILQMTHQFAEDETALKLMGADSQQFDPDQEYSYSPVSSNIEMEYNKNKKIANYDQHIGRLAGLAETIPQVLPIIAHMIRRTLELQGDEYQTISKMIEGLATAKPQVEGEGGGMPKQQIPNMNTPESSNQYGMPVTPQEEDGRLGGML